MRFPALATIALCVAIGLAAQAVDLASVVSRDAVLYAEVADPKGIWQDFQQSGLRDMIRGMPNGEIQFRLVAGMAQQLALQQLGIRLGPFVETYAPRLAVVLPDVPDGPQPPLCVLLDATGKKDALQALLRNTVEATVRAQHPNATFGDDLHQDIPVRMLSAGQQEAAYAFLDDIFVVGPQAAVRKIIDLRALRPLAADEAFVAVRRKLRVEKGVVAYVNLRRLLEHFRPQLDANPELARRLDDLGVTTAQWAAWAIAFEGRGIRDRVHLYTGDRKVGLVRLVTSLSPGASAAAAVLPSDCPLVAALTFKDGPELWNAILRYLEEGGQVEHLARIDANRQTVMLRMGVQFDRDIVGALGGEIVLAANPDTVAEFAARGKVPGRSDFPYIIGLRVADRGAMEASVHRFVASQPVVGQGVTRAVEKHRGTEISILTLPGVERKPAYAFVGDYLLIAKSAALIRRCIDGAAGQEPLAQLRQYQALLKKMPSKYSGMLYADVETLLVAATTGGRGVPEQPPIPPNAALASQLRRTCAVLAAEEDGLTLETYTRPGLLGVLGALLSLRAGTALALPVPGKADL